MPRNVHGRYLSVADLMRHLAEAERLGARYVFVSAAGTLVLTRGRTLDPRGVVGHVDVEAGRFEPYPQEVER